MSDIPEALVAECTCVPCETPAWGAPGIAHCAACCGGTLIAEYSHDCPTAEHREMAERQFPTPDETCPNGCVRFGDWWVPEACPEHLGVTT